MGDPFRQFFLESIQNAIQQDICEESLLCLFRFVNPSLKLEELLGMDQRERSKMMKVLKNVQNFYDECMKSISNKSSLTPKGKNSSRKKRKRPQSTELSSIIDKQFPQSFNALEKWPIAKMALSTSKPKLTPVVTPSSLEDKNDKVKKNPSPPPPKLQSPPPMTHPLPPNEILTKTTIPAFQAYKCLHARGAIAHEKPITKYYTWTEIQKDADEKKSVNDIFEKFGGTKEIDSVDAIKEELMNRGPVVSVSFRLLSDYLDQLTVGKKAFAKELIGGVHELLIVGWCLTPYGEAWQIQPLIDESSEPKDLKAGAKSDALIQIGFGQFGIDDTVMAPASSLDNIPWQHGPYFDSDFSGIENWRSWEEMDLPIMETELKILAQNCFKKGLMLGGSFVLRDQNRKAHSARYEVKNVKWMEDTSEWFVTICRQGKC